MKDISKVLKEMSVWHFYCQSSDKIL